MTDKVVTKYRTPIFMLNLRKNVNSTVFYGLFINNLTYLSVDSGEPYDDTTHEVKETSLIRKNYRSLSGS